jgi:hypothetical protein
VLPSILLDIAFDSAQATVNNIRSGKAAIRWLSGVEATDQLPRYNIPTMATIHAFSIFFQFVWHSVYQCFLFLSAPSLHLFFPVKSIINSGVFFKINKLDRQPFLRMVCSLSRLMLS